jgi:hypothetical protein
VEKWYEKFHRYGQTNLTEIDPEVCDIAFWRDFWKKTGTQAVIVNAGGIVAYYPSRFKNHYRAAKLGNRDLFGEFCAEARDAGLAVLARMDINRAVKEFYDESPGWFARNRDGSPYITQGRYMSCVNSGYYKEFIPELLREIIEKYHPDGFTDNSWTGIKKDSICYCDNCKNSFYNYCGEELPEKADYRNPVYRKWVKWGYESRLANWDLYNRVAREAGGEDCLWLGMANANFVAYSSFCDLREVAKRSKIIMVDQQSRDGNGFEQNSLNGLVLHQMAGWDKIIPESMATYTRGVQAYRRGASQALELELWMLEGIAGGITPWWHIIGGAQEDKRIFDLPVRVMQWHQKYENYLYNRIPVANIGIVWSQANADFYGGIKSKELLELSWRGIIMALTRAGLPYLPVNADDISEQAKDLDLLILPQLGLVTESQAAAIEKFVERGGNILATGNTGIMNEDGSLRQTSRLEKLLGVHFNGIGQEENDVQNSWEIPALHTYIRMENRQSPVFAGFGNTVILPMGGIRCNVSAAAQTGILASFIPAYPMYPPEFVWTDVTRTDKPVITEYSGGGGRVIYAAWDLDACYGRAAHPDHGDLLKNTVLYLLEGRIPVRVECDAYIDFKVYRQDKRIIIHLINVNHSGFAQGYAEKNIPVGPVKISLRLPDIRVSSARATEDGQQVKLTRTDGGGEGIALELASLGVHQLIILE